MLSKNQRRILAILINHPEKDFSLSEMGVLLGKHPGVFQRTVQTLEKENMILSKKRGNQRLLKINKNFMFWKELQSIIQKTEGVEGNLKQLTNKLKLIVLAIIYGSYAKDSMKPHSDIDLLVVGNPKAESKLLSMLSALEKQLGREVNYKFYTKKEFQYKRKKNDPFLKEIFNNQYIILKGKL